MVESFFGDDGESPQWWPDKRHVYVCLTSRVVADFRGAAEDPDAWTEQIGKLQNALRKQPEAAASDRG